MLLGKSFFQFTENWKLFAAAEAADNKAYSKYIVEVIYKGNNSFNSLDPVLKTLFIYIFHYHVRLKVNLGQQSQTDTMFCCFSCAAAVVCLRSEHEELEMFSPSPWSIVMATLHHG